MRLVQGIGPTRDDAKLYALALCPPPKVKLQNIFWNCWGGGMQTFLPSSSMIGYYGAKVWSHPLSKYVGRTTKGGGPPWAMGGRSQLLDAMTQNGLKV